MKDYVYQPYVKAVQEPCKHSYVDRITFGHPGKILECIKCGKVKIISMFSK